MPCEKICTVRFDSTNTHPSFASVHNPNPPKKRSPTPPHPTGSDAGVHTSTSCHSHHLFSCPHPSFSFPRDRSKLLCRNDDHPSRNRSEGGRLHHLPLPQRGLVEAGAVLAAGVSQWPGLVIKRDGDRKREVGREKDSCGRWRRSSGEDALPAATSWCD